MRSNTVMCMDSARNAARSRNSVSVAPVQHRLTLNVPPRPATERPAFGAVDKRAFWRAQARFHLARAREWKAMLGSSVHTAALHWYVKSIERAALYRLWIRTLGSAR